MLPRWLRRLMRRRSSDETEPMYRMPVPREFIRAHRIARLLDALMFYADAANYRSQSQVDDTSAVARDSGRRAREAIVSLHERVDQTARIKRGRDMTHAEMLEAALQRPRDYHELPPETQWAIDRKLGILDWDGPRTDEERARLRQHRRKPD